MSVRRVSIIHGSLLVVVLSLCVGQALAQNENETVGFRANHAFESGQFGENIDVLNGGLNLTVPIGQRFQVNSRLGTSLTLSYNSKVWDTSYFRSGFIQANEAEIVTNAEGPFGIGFTMHLGRIFVDWHYQAGCYIGDYRSCYSGDWKWVSPDGTQHEIYNYANLQIMPPDPGVSAPPAATPPSNVPVFNRRATSDLSYALVSGPDNQYCVGKKDDGTPETGCFRVETPDGLVYTLAKRVDCPEPDITNTNGRTPFQNQRGENQSFCGWYTTLIEDPSVGQRSVDGTGQIVPYPNHVKVTYNKRTGFKHAIRYVLDSTGRSTRFHSCSWALGGSCVPGSEDEAADELDYPPTDPSAVATYAVDLPSNASDSSALHPELHATYRFSYRFGKIRKAHSDFEGGSFFCNVPDCAGGHLMTHDPVLELERIDYPPYTRPSQSGAEEYSLYYGYRTDLTTIDDSYGEITCRTLPVLRKSGGAVIMTGDPCTSSGAWARFDYTHDYYLYVAAILSNGSSITKKCYPPDTCDAGPSGGIAGQMPTGVTRHVTSKKVENPAGTTLGPAQWTYTRYGVTLTNPSTVVVTDPLQNDTVYLYHASSSSQDPSLGSAPQDGYAPEWNDGMNYQIDYYQGTGATRRLLRSEIREYDADHDVVQSQQLSKTNVRPKRVITRYHDDGARDQIVTRNGWDGFGHWRSETESGFDVSEPRTTRSAYSDGSRCSTTTTLACDRGTTPSVCPAGENCVANPNFYETDLQLMKEVSDGMSVLSRTDSVYTSRGKLVRTIARATTPAMIGAPPPVEPANQADWLRLTQGPGDVMTELAYGGTSGNAISKTMTSGRAGDPTYAIKYTYLPAAGTCTVAEECGGYLATKVFLTSPGGPAAGWKAIDRLRDANTGQIFATRDTAMVRTDYDYDALGRVAAIRPTGEQPTVVDYVSLLETTVTQGTHGPSDLDPWTDFVFTRYLYDGLGRQVATQKRPTDPNRGFACQKTQYDVMNNVTFQTEWKYQTSCSALPVPPQSQCFAYGVLAQDPGSESDYRDPETGACDPFGRARLQIAADANRATGDKVVRTDYFGTSSRVTVNSVRAAGGASFPVTTAYFKDALGRLLAVDESSGRRCSTSGNLCTVDPECGTGQTCVAADGGADAEYLYDAADRLTEVTLTDNLLERQTRRFGYDGLGHQAWAENPENGTTSFLSYDALGNPLAVQDGKGNLQKFHYDFAGRPTEHGVIAAGNAAETFLSRNYYDEATGGAYPLGKVTSVFSFDPSGAGVATERRTYSGLGGRLSSFSVAFTEWGDVNKETTTYTYTNRGELATIGYPQESPSIHTPLVVNYAYANGSLLSATENGLGTLLGRVTYNAAGGVETVDMAGGGRTSMTYDTRNRPSSITAGWWVGGAWNRTDYTSGTYAYDGAGNIYQIGANRYGYDAANRLISAHTEFEGTSYDEIFAYDIYGNMGQRQLTTLSTTSVTETENFGFGSPRTNQIATRQTTVGSATPSAVTFRYDLNGNLVEGGRRWNPTPSTTDEDVKSFEYDTLNRLLRIQRIGDTVNHVALSEVNTFAYDAAGNRVRKGERGGAALGYYVRDVGGRVLSEFRSSGTTATREWAADYVYLGDRLLALKENLRPRPVTRLSASQSASPTPGKWRISLAWDASPDGDIQSYRVYRKQGAEPAFSSIATPTGTTFADPTDFNPGVLVLYEVAAVKTTTEESNSRPQVGLTTADTGGPSAPSLSGSTGDGRVTLSWTASTDASSTILGYEVQRRTSSGGTPYVLTSPLVKGTTFVDANLTNGSMYYYRVRAKDAAGNWGALSCQPAGQCDLGLTPRDLAPPAAPKGLVVHAACVGSGGSNPVSLTWEANPPGDGIVSYEVYRNTVPQFGGTILPNPGPSTTYSDGTSLNPGTTYYYAVRAVDNATPTANRSAWSPPVGVFVRNASTVPQVDIQARGSDGSVSIHWQSPFPVVPLNPVPTKYLIYRKPSAVQSCAAYQLIGDVPASYLGDFTDGGVENNAAYDYAMTAISGTSESGFSRAGLGIPLARPRNIVQCAADDPWSQGSGLSTVVSWTAPQASFYQPLYATTTGDTFGYLKGYHLYHHKICSRPGFNSSWEIVDYFDNNPIKIVVPPPSSPSNPSNIDPYLVDGTNGIRYDLADPRYLITPEHTTLEPASTYPYNNQLIYMDCNGNQDKNCVMPKAVYKVYANGTWLTAESDWPDYFDPFAVDPRDRCDLTLKNPDSLPSCSDPGANPSFVPPPRKITATASGPGAITLDWVPPIIPAGKPPIAGYYLYARSFVPMSDRHSFKAPLPFATVGPAATTVTLEGLGSSVYGYTQFSVATLDEAGHVSGTPGRACTKSGAECGATNSCAQKYCDNTGVACATASDCSTYGVCTVGLNACTAASPCSQWACNDAPHAACTRVDHWGTTHASNGNGTKTLAVDIGLSSVPNQTLVAFVITRGASTGLVSSISQTGASWNPADKFANSSGISAEMWYTPNLNNPGSTVTFTFVPNSLAVEVFIARYSGILSSGAVDKVFHMTGTGVSPTTGVTAQTSQPDEIWIGGLGSAIQGSFSAPTPGYSLIDSAIGSGTTAGKYLSGALYHQFATTQGTAGVSATLSPSPGGLWIGIAATFKTAIQSTCSARTSCAIQSCRADACNTDFCADSIGRWCQSDPNHACTTAADCPAYATGHCNVTTTQTCNPAAPGCPTGQTCLSEDACTNYLNSAVAFAPSSTSQPPPPGALKTILWTVNDTGVLGRGRDGIKLGWVTGYPSAQTSAVQGYRVYRSVTGQGGWCALVDTGTRTLPLPTGVTVCTSDAAGHTVDADAYSTNYSSTHRPVLYDSQLYWDRTVAPDRLYYYRISQVELNGTLQETPFASTNQVTGRALGYDPNVLPPPQRFRAGASQIGTLADQQSVSLRWCPPPAAAGLPTVTEYRIYKKLEVGEMYLLFAKVAPTCLNANSRCEINATNRCSNDSGVTQTCSVIQPTTPCGGSGQPRCGVVDHAFTCWPYHSNKPDYQAMFDYDYYVTSVIQPGATPIESAPSEMNRAWLNYCGDQDPPGNFDCPPASCTWSERRDPDGNTDTGTDAQVCGDEDVRLTLPGAEPDTSVAQVLPPMDLDMAPHRIIGGQPCDEDIGCGGGGGGGENPYNPPARWVFYHLDHLGSVRAELNAFGAVVSKHHYLPFGEERPSQADPSLNTKGFTGHERDKESGLDYMMARYYSSSLDRFTSVDPGNDIDSAGPQSWNMYAYVRNSPVGRFDRTGRAGLDGGLIASEWKASGGKLDGPPMFTAKQVESAAKTVGHAAGALADVTSKLGIAAAVTLQPEAPAIFLGSAIAGGIKTAADGVAVLANPSEENKAEFNKSAAVMAVSMMAEGTLSSVPAKGMNDTIESLGGELAGGLAESAAPSAPSKPKADAPGGHAGESMRATDDSHVNQVGPHMTPDGAR